MDFKQKLKDVPENPGVYMMLDEGGGIIYVGKAKNLRKRLRQYFYVTGNKTVKVMAMLEHVADFRYIICASEVDALLTENNLIKKHTPRYNILLKDDKSYPFLRIDMKEQYPAIRLVRTLKNDGASYFGPYMQSVNIRDIFDLIHTAFKVRDCSRDLTKPSRPCLNKHLEKCLAPCSGKISSEEYRAEVLRVIAFLKGNDREVERVLTERMKHFSDVENFEVALGYRNKLQVLDKLVRKQVSSLPKDFNLDIFAFETNGVNSSIGMLVVRGGKLVGGENTTVKCADEDLTSYILQYYNKNAPLCEEIVTDGIDEVEAVEEAIKVLADRVVRVIEPKQGVRKQLLELAHSNAHDALEKFGSVEERTQLRTVGAVSKLSEVLNLQILPNRIEAFDISHISGTDKVASMVVFENGEAKRSHYRKFKIKTVEGNNDFASMKEVLTRRLQKFDDTDESFSSVPDLILVDGGKGQLSYALDALAKTGHSDLQMLALAERDEEIYLSSNPLQPIILSKDNIALQLLQRVRDEAHRFAITFHRSARAKHLKESELTKYSGIGDARAKLLLKHFGSVKAVKEATVEELAKVEGFKTKTAEKIYNAIHSNKTE
ncbi:MAG: excinuclease ABC subunit UvrC [Clostridia bacterium]